MSKLFLVSVTKKLDHLNAYIIPIGTEEYRYTKDGEEKSGVQFQFKMEFPQKKSSGKKK